MEHPKSFSARPPPWRVKWSSKSKLISVSVSPSWFFWCVCSVWPNKAIINNSSPFAHCILYTIVVRGCSIIIIIFRVFLDPPSPYVINRYHLAWPPSIKNRSTVLSGFGWGWVGVGLWLGFKKIKHWGLGWVVGIVHNKATLWPYPIGVFPTGPSVAIPIQINITNKVF